MLKPDIRHAGQGFNTVNIMWALELHEQNADTVTASGECGFTPQRYEGLRCWLYRLNLLNQIGGVSFFADQIKVKDPYFDSKATLMMLHWKLFINPAMVAFRWYFGHYIRKNSANSFDILLTDLERWCKNQGYKIATVTLSKQLKTMLKLYVYNKADDIEERFNSPLADLGIVRSQHSYILDENAYQTQELKNLDAAMLETFSQCLKLFFKRFSKENLVAFDDFLLHDFSPCKAFNFTQDTAFLVLDQLQEQGFLHGHFSSNDEKKRNKVELIK